MDSTLTLRLTRAQREALKRRAASERLTESAFLRTMINREIRRGFNFDQVSHLLGSIASTRTHREKDPWRMHIRARNWR